MYSAPVRAVAVSAAQTGIVIGDTLIVRKRRKGKRKRKEEEGRERVRDALEGRREGERRESERC